MSDSTPIVELELREEGVWIRVLSAAISRDDTALYVAIRFADNAIHELRARRPKSGRGPYRKESAGVR